MSYLKTNYLAVVLLLSLPGTVTAMAISGQVKDEHGNAVAGALVTLMAEDGLYAETVYSGNSGEFQLDSGITGKASVRIRKPGFITRKLLAADSSPVIQMQSVSSEKELATQLTTSAYIAALKFRNEQERRSFHVDCLSCHQLGNEYTRAKRSRDHWRLIVTRMLGFWGVTDKKWIERYVDILADGFNGQSISTTQQHVIKPRAMTAKIFEWKLPEGIISHDVEFHQGTGKFYTVDQGSDRIYITDPLTNTTKMFTMPADGVPQGGKFFQLYGMSTPYGLAVHHGPHSLQQGSDGHFYITNTVSSGIGEFDPETLAFVNHDIGGKALYPHTLRFDNRTSTWFTLSASNQAGKFDIATGEMRLLDLPDTTTRPQMTARMPYGIDIHPLDGSVWYSRLHANLIGRIDPETLRVEEFDPGINGPRRLRFGVDGILWIPAFGDGQLVRLDPAAMEYKRYTLPPLAPGEIEAPYAVGVHPETGDVWVTATTSDRLFRFLPGEERFIHYPLPTRGTYLRDMIFLPNGHACAASSPVPAIPTVVEGGMQAIVCVDPGE